MNFLDLAGKALHRANKTQPAPQVALRHVGSGITGSILATVVFADLFHFVEDHGQAITPFDQGILLWMHGHQRPGFTQAAKALARIGSPPVIVGVGLGAALAGLTWPKIRGAAWTFPVAIVGSGIIIQGVKLVIKRPRPSFFDPLLKESGFSFPSGHSLIAMVVYGLFGYFLLHLFQGRKARLAVRASTVLLVIAIGASRVYVGVHYPTDVLAGWTAGVPWLISCLALHEVLARRWPSSGEPVLEAQADSAGEAHSALAAAKTLLLG